MLQEEGNGMPQKPKTPCRYPGCSALCEEAYCDKHRQQVNHEYNTQQRDKAASSFYASARWRSLRKQKLALNPMCEECARQNRLTPATMVDHIIPIKQGGQALDMENLQSLCWSCHSAKSILEGSRFGR
ncbi:MAG TPA: HNH endonuclease [Clostridia bacterium]|nr:HNH endonuclease [Clostridia bacterium]